MEEHLCRNGFMPNYLVWHAHGEQARRVVVPEHQEDGDDRMHDMLNDLGMDIDFDPAGQSQVPPEVLEFYRLLDASEEKLHDCTEKTVLY